MFRNNIVAAVAMHAELLYPAEFYGMEVHFFANGAINLIHVLLIHVDADVRQETTPKAGWLPISVLAAFAYIRAIVAFAVIFVSESHKSTTETLIMTTDNTSQDGYACTMISKVTASY
jgi:hypothetical protein